MTSLDDPEVRALASRYGDPDYLLAEDWIPEVPGINAPGDYMKDYAAQPRAIRSAGARQSVQGHVRTLLPGGARQAGDGASADRRPAAQEMKKPIYCTVSGATGATSTNAS